MLEKSKKKKREAPTLSYKLTHTHKYTLIQHTLAYIKIRSYVSVCVCMYERAQLRERKWGNRIVVMI